MATFEYLHVSLVSREQGDLFAKRVGPADRGAKRDFLESVFERQRWDFEYNKRHFALLKEHRIGNIIVFRIGKQKLELGHDGPDEHFSPVYQENWELAWALFDLESENQYFVVQSNIGSPRPILKALFSAIESSSLEYPYRFEVEYISDIDEFWAAVSEYSGKITRLDFNFLPPNAIEMTEKIKAIVVAAKAQLGSDVTTISHVNKDGGLHPDKNDEYTTAALDVVSEGGGSTRMKSGKSVIYSSSKNRKTESIENSELPEDADNKELLHDLINKLTGSMEKNL